MTKETNHLQEAFLTRLYRTRMPVTMFLMNGYQLRGIITGFDAFVVVLTSDGRQQVIYKHAISTISPERGTAAGGGVRPERNKAMKQGTLITRIIILVLFLGIAAYFGVYVWSSLTSGSPPPRRTATPPSGKVTLHRLVFPGRGGAGGRLRAG